MSSEPAKRNNDPLYALPYEIWLECMRLYAHDQPDGPLVLLNVSVAWESRLLESPQLWTTIYYDGGHDEECRAECFFHLSGTLPVRLVIGRTPGKMTGALKYCHKISSLFFWGITISQDSLFGASFFPKRFDDEWYSNIIRLYKVPLRHDEVALQSSMGSALPTLVRLLEEMKLLVNQSNPQAVVFDANLASLYYYQGRYKKAQEISENVLSIWTTSLGKYQPNTNTVTTISNLIAIYSAQKNQTKARPLLRTLATLATRRAARGRNIVSEELRLEVLEQSRVLLGREHKDSVEAAEVLIPIYIRQYRYNAAALLQEEVLRQVTRVLGPNHFDSIAELAHLAVIYYNQGRWSESEGLQLKVLEEREEDLEPGHPDMFRAIVNLAATYSAQGLWSKAEALEKQELVEQKHINGWNHPDTIAVAGNLAVTYHDQGR